MISALHRLSREIGHRDKISKQRSIKFRININRMHLNRSVGQLRVKVIIKLKNLREVR